MIPPSLLSLALLALTSVAACGADSYDVVVYGGTSAGVIVAVQAAKMGKSVVIIEPSRRIGGMTSGGLGHVDTGNVKSIGGLSLEFFQRVGARYGSGHGWSCD